MEQTQMPSNARFFMAAFSSRRTLSGAPNRFFDAVCTISQGEDANELPAVDDRECAYPTPTHALTGRGHGFGGFCDERTACHEVRGAARLQAHATVAAVPSRERTRQGAADVAVGNDADELTLGRRDAEMPNAMEPHVADDIRKPGF